MNEESILNRLQRETQRNLKIAQEQLKSIDKDHSEYRKPYVVRIEKHERDLIELDKIIELLDESK